MNNQPTQTTAAPTPVAVSSAPVGQLNAKRGLAKFILLNIITLGIYGIVFFSGISADINVIASRYDGRKTMHYCLLLFLVGPITLGIAYLVWFHRLSAVSEMSCAAGRFRTASAPPISGCGMCLAP